MPHDRHPGAARGGGSGMDRRDPETDEIEKKVERKQNQTAAYAIAIAGLPS